MDLHDKLRIVTYVGLSVGFLAGVTSQFWKSSVEIEGTTRKQLTTAGWISFGISLVGLLTGVGSEIIRHKLEYEAGQSSQQRTNELIASTQPLTSLRLQWTFSASDPKLWKVMQDGETEIQENAESSQGGVPRTPFEFVDYKAALLPLLSYIARVGPPRLDDDQLEGDGSRLLDDNSIVVLIPLDDSQNAILSFGQIGSGVSWYQRGEATAPSAGFKTSSLQKEPRPGESIPHASTNLAPTGGGVSTYSIDWSLDPATLANSIDRVNPNVSSTAKLPRVLMIAIFYNIRTLPFREADFATTYATNLWTGGDYDKRNIDFKSAMTDVELSLAVNGAQVPIYRYTLKKIYEKHVVDQYDDEIGTRCTMLEFEAVSTAA